MDKDTQIEYPKVLCFYLAKAFGVEPPPAFVTITRKDAPVHYFMARAGK